MRDRSGDRIDRLTRRRGRRGIGGRRKPDMPGGEAAQGGSGQQHGGKGSTRKGRRVVGVGSDELMRFSFVSAWRRNARITVAMERP